MNPSYVVGHLLGMAIPTINRFQVIGMGKAFVGCIGVTGETAVAVVNGASKNGGIHIHGYSPAIEHSCHLFVLMTHHAILISLRMQLGDGSNEKKKKDQ